MNEDLLARIRNGQSLTFAQKIKLVITLSMPSIMAQLTSIIMQYIDAAMVGRLGANASAAIGVVASSTWLFSGLCRIFHSGCPLYWSKRICQGERSSASFLFDRACNRIFTGSCWCYHQWKAAGMAWQ